MNVGPIRLQCDQMAKLFVQYLAIYDNEKLTNIIKIAKAGSIFF